MGMNEFDIGYIYIGRVNMNEFGPISSTDINGNSGIRDATQNYLNTSTTNLPWNINDVVQQGGGNSTQQGGSSGGGTTPPATIEGISAVNGVTNVTERLEYFKSAMAEQAETNLEGLFETFFVDGPMKSILENGANSEYLSELDKEDAELIASYVKEAYENARDVLYLRNSENVSPEEQKAIGLQAASFANSQIGFWGNVANLSGKLQGLKANKGFPLLAGLTALSTAFLSLYVADNDFKTRYPHAREAAWQEILGHQPSLMENLNFSNRVKVNTYIREIDPDRYDKIELARVDYFASVIPGTVDCLIAAILLIDPAQEALAPVFSGASLAITGFFGYESALAKTMYLNKVRPDENNSAWGQLFGTGFGGGFENINSNLKNSLKGNTNPSSSQNIVEPSGNMLQSNLLAEANASASTTELVFSGGAGNDTLFNVENNFQCRG